MFKWKMVCLTFAVVVGVFFSSGVASSQASSDSPVNLHLTWQHSNMSSTITVTWQTSYMDSGASVAYDNRSRNGEPSIYTYTAHGVTHTYAGASGYVHDVELTDLAPDTTYYYVCGGEIGGYSSERSFWTAPVQPSYLRFVFGGDSRGNSFIRDNISIVMSQLNPSFVLFGGDMVNSGYSQTDWNSFLQSMSQYWIANNNLTIPIIPSLGNHEENATNYYEQFALPNNEQWYSLDWGETVHFIVLNSEISPSDEQLSWLENDLALHQNYTWKFVLFHRPLFSSGVHGSWIEARQYWCPLFDRYHVDIVFSGHDHDYERSKPINYTADKTLSQESYADGTMYVVSGGYGALPYSSGTSWWTAYSTSLYNFVVVDVFSNGTLNLQAKNLSGTTFDAVMQKVPVLPEFSWSSLLLALITATALVSATKKKRDNLRGNARATRVVA